VLTNQFGSKVLGDTRILLAELQEHMKNNQVYSLSGYATMPSYGKKKE
jgi:hypothetical protein